VIQGQIGGTAVMVLSGRAHLYEGFSAADVVFGVRVLGLLGIHSLILTNASGTLDKTWTPGRLALIRDHINLQGTSPLVGPGGESFGPRFVDMSEPYDSARRNLARQAAAGQGIDLLEGVYAAVLGPNFETPAEIKYLRTIGADMVGMSTVQETIAARQMGMKVLGISLITNWGSGLSARPLSHEEVLAAGAAARPQLSGLLKEIVTRLESRP
jgi:purine-nucleoside phosphorylase